MRRDHEGPETKAELNEGIEALLRAACKNEVDVTGAFEIVSGAETATWEAHITEVARPGDASPGGRS